MPADREISPKRLAERIGALPGFVTVRDAAGRTGVDAHLVGGAVRDALLGLEATNLDLVVSGDHLALVDALGGEARVHDRFGTATVTVDGAEIDLARARAETYAQPGALPQVHPAELIEDLGRRDFTVNALAVPLADPGALIDDHGGLADLGAGALRILHDRSFVDDPTRALRGARYAARLGFEPEPRTLELLNGADLTTVSQDRVAAELGKLASEPEPRPGFELLDRWGLIDLAPGAGALIDAVARLLDRRLWSDVAPRPVAVLAAVAGAPPEVGALLQLEPGSPSAAVAAARGHSGVELALARVLGAAWLDEYVGRWQSLGLEISGEDLIGAGVPEGPAVGRGLAAALRAKLDGETGGRDDELRIALEAAAS